MPKINEVKNRINNNLNRMRPQNMDEFIDIVHSTTGAGNYGTRFQIVKFMGYYQGLRVLITGRSKTHILPKNGEFYCLVDGLEKYEKAGYPVTNN